MTGLILLAAGNSSRLGTPKQLIVWEGRTLLRRAAEAAVASGCFPIVVVLGAHAGRIAREVVGLPVRLAYNPAWESGMGSSIRVGTEVLIADSPRVDGVVITVCDQPHCDAATIRKLVDDRRKGTHRIIAARYDGVCGVPALFDRTLFPELLALDGKPGARHVLERHEQDMASVGFLDGACDIDTLDDLARLVNTNL